MSFVGASPFETAIVGGSGDDGFKGTAWLFKRTNGVWTQVGQKIVGSGGSGQPLLGSSVALSVDSSTVALGGPNDLNETGAVWAFVRPGAHDFDGDNRSDILSRHRTGGVAIWEMLGSFVLS